MDPPSCEKAVFYRLIYLDCKGLGEAIRLAFAVQQIPFEDKRVTYAEVNELRSSGVLPTGQVPVLEVHFSASAGSTPSISTLQEEKIQRFSQSDAILRYVGRLKMDSNLYPVEDPKRALRCDTVLNTLGDIQVVLRAQWYGSVLGRSPLDGETLVQLSESQKDEVVRHLNETILPARFAILEKILSESEHDFFCGEQMAICDIAFFVMGSGIRDETYCQGILPQVMDNCPLLLQLLERIGCHESVVAWYKNQSGRKLETEI